MTLYLLKSKIYSNSAGLRTTDLAEIALGWVALVAFWAVWQTEMTVLLGVLKVKFTYLEHYFEHLTTNLNDFFSKSSKRNHLYGKNSYKTHFWNSEFLCFSSLHFGVFWIFVFLIKKIGPNFKTSPKKLNYIFNNLDWNTSKKYNYIKVFLKIFFHTKTAEAITYIFLIDLCIK